MGIEWFRDLSITIMAFAGAVAFLITTIVLLRLQRTAKDALQEFKVASILTRDTAVMVHDGVKPISAILSIFQGARDRSERRSTGDRKHGR